MNNDYGPEEAEGYLFDEADEAVLATTKLLVTKVLGSHLPSDAEREVVFTIANALASLPDVVSNLNISFTLTGPRRKFGDHEIYHFWTVEFVEDQIEIASGGHFYRPSTGGDTFTSFRWGAYPGFETECHEYSSSLRIVDDAKPFASEIHDLDLSERGYSVTAMIDGEDVGDENDDEEEEDDDCSDDEHESPDTANGELTVCFWAFLDANTKLIYALAGRAYWLTGDDESKLQTLRQLSRCDFQSVGRVRVPGRFAISFTDGTKEEGYATVQQMNDPSAMLFEELLSEMEASLPPLADFEHNKPVTPKFPEDPLSVRTIVYEDESGSCRAIVDENDMEWLRQQN